MIKLSTDSCGDISFMTHKFSGGELQPKITSMICGSVSRLTIKADLFSSDDIMELILIVDAIRRIDETLQLHLICPYLPYARQDRVCDEGESLALKVMCNIINSLKFDLVTVWDVHSNVALALLDRVENVHQSFFLPRINTVMHLNDVVLVAPDSGATSKTLACAKVLGIDMVRADKIRSVQTGKITGTTVYSDHIGDKSFLMVDDICDGGATFIELAKVLRLLTNGKIYLYVTHGIFSKGLTVFDGLIDHIFTVNPFPNVDLKNPILTVL